MVEVTIEDPMLHQTRKVDDRGRVYVGKEYSGEELTVIVDSNE